MMSLVILSRRLTVEEVFGAGAEMRLGPGMSSRKRLAAMGSTLAAL